MSIIAQNALPNFDVDTLWSININGNHQFLIFVSLILVLIKKGKIINERI
jgi:hypothetical protein